MRPIACFSLAAIVVGVAVAASPAPAAAQRLAADVVRPAPAVAAERVVATYRFFERRDTGLPVEVTLTDRGGHLTATYRLSRKGDAQPMEVSTADGDLLLSAGTPRGLLTLRIEQDDLTPTGPARGRWTLASRSGELRGWTRLQREQ